VNDVMTDASNRRVTVLTDAEMKKVKAPKAEQPAKKKNAAKKKNSAATSTSASAVNPAAISAAQKSESALVPSDSLIGQPCPLCGKGYIIKGRTAYGCSDYQHCTWRLPFAND
jgi:DNA topoisomerase-3